MPLPAPAEPTGNRFALVTPNNNSAPIIIVTILSLVFSCLIFSVRIFLVKWKRHSLDDAVLGLGHVIAIGHWAAMLVAVESGLGQSVSTIPPGNRNTIASALLAARILFLLVLCFSKLSLLLIIRALFYWESKIKSRIIDATLLLVVLWGIVASLALSVSCSSSYVFDASEAECPEHVIRLGAIMVVERVTCSAIFIYPVIFLYSFAMAAKKKMLVVAAFSFTLPCIVLSTFYVRSTIVFLTHPRSGLTIVTPLVLQEILLAASLMSATVPCLKSFMEGFLTGGVSYVTEDPTIRWQTQSGGYDIKWFQRISRSRSDGMGSQGKMDESKISGVPEEDSSTGVLQVDSAGSGRPSETQVVEGG